MAQVFLGELLLRWCGKCGVPVLGRKCGACGGETRRVELTPPGDVRPGFEFDRKLIADTIDAQFGEGCGEAVLPEGALFILNKTPAIDRMDEVIVGGEVIGAVRYDVEKLRWSFLPRISAAKTLLPKAKRGLVVADKGAVGPISQGANLLGPGVTSASGGIQPGDELLVTDTEMNVIATGASKMSTEQMKALSRGVAVKTRWFDDGKPKAAALSAGACGHANECTTGAAPAAPKPNWGIALMANSAIMENKIHDSVAFIRKTAEERKKPVAVSFSGGKDSLAALLLALDAGLRPKMLFIDTGLEFEETRESVRETAERFGLEVVQSNAGGKFWEAVKFFGPPGRDFRWCCKTCKLGPVTRVIKEHFPGGVLSLIGQRRYESEQRANKGKVWENPWVPGQIGASPIQNWTALHVWLYLFAKQKEISAQSTESKSLRVKASGSSECDLSSSAGEQISHSVQSDQNTLVTRHSPLVTNTASAEGNDGSNRTNAIAGAAKEKLWNPLYEQGFDRIGCWLCPASDMAEFDLISRMSGARGTGETARGEGSIGGEMAHSAAGGDCYDTAGGVKAPELARFQKLLRDYADKFGYTDDWIKYGVWRWRRMPPMIKEIVDRNGIKLRKEGAAQNDKKPLEFYSASGYQSCTGGISIEGVFNAQLDLDRVANLLNAMGEPEYDPCTAVAALGKSVTIQKEGYVAVKGRDEQEARKRLDEIRQIILRAQNCVGCGVCIGRCRAGALQFGSRKSDVGNRNCEGGADQIWITPEKCLHCGACLGKCPAVDFGEREFEF